MPSEQIYECQCGSTTFHLLRNCDIRCTECYSTFTDMKVSFPDDIPVDGAQPGSNGAVVDLTGVATKS
jgi:hypothetical protein